MRLIFLDNYKTKLSEKYRLLFGGPGSGPQGGDGDTKDSETTTTGKKSDSLPSEISNLKEYKADTNIGNKGLADETHDILSAMGLNPSNITQSDTDYGTSRYIKIDNPILVSGYTKIRISDHSVTNPSRVSDEIHLKHDTIGAQLENIERQIHPDRYNPIEKTKRVDINSAYLKPTDKKIDGTERKLNGNSNIDVVSVDRKYTDYERKEPLKL